MHPFSCPRRIGGDPQYGYDNVDGQMVIVLEQVDIVKEIFREILAGKSTHALKKELNEREIPTKKGREMDAQLN